MLRIPWCRLLLPTFSPAYRPQAFLYLRALFLSGSALFSQKWQSRVVSSTSAAGFPVSRLCVQTKAVHNTGNGVSIAPPPPPLILEHGYPRPLSERMIY